MKHRDYIINGKKFEVDILSFDGHDAEVRVNGTTYKVEVPEMKPGKPAAAAPETPPDRATPAPKNPGSAVGIPTDGRVLSPMPGTILKVFVEEGQVVSSGDPLMTLEAMKMENGINALRDGSIKKIHVSKGTEVRANSLLLEYD